MSRNQIFETLAALGAGAIILSGCAGSPEPVKGTDVPAASGTPEATPPSSAQPAAAETGAAKAPDAVASPSPSGTPAATPSGTPAAATSALPMAKDMPKGNKTQKVRDSKRPKPCQSGCGEGTCGSC